VGFHALEAIKLTNVFVEFYMEVCNVCKKRISLVVGLQNYRKRPVKSRKSNFLLLKYIRLLTSNFLVAFNLTTTKT